MKKTLFFTLLLFTVSLCSAQKVDWISNNIFATNLFVENKGQFDFLTKDKVTSDYAYIHSGNEIYLSENGFTFRLSKLEPKAAYAELTPEELREKREEVETHDIIDNWVSLQWIGANANAQVVTYDKSGHYFTYGDKKYNSHGFSSVRYNGIYDGIDVLFELHPKGGLKYTLFLSPGADINDIQFKYSGQKDLTVEDGKTIRMKTDIEDIWDGELNAFYANGESVDVRYVIDNNVLGFKTSKPLDSQRPFVIDPWVTTNTTLTGSGGAAGGQNKAYDVDFDIDGNLYVIGGGAAGGSTPNAYPKIAKYDPNGVLLWTFSGVVVTPSWSTCPTSFARVGNLVVNKISSKTYISQGLNTVTPGVQIIRLDPAGNYDNFITPPNNQFREVWEMKFNCNTGSIVAMGGGTTSNINFGIIDTTTGAVAISNATNLGGVAQDIVCSAVGPNGEVYSLFSAGAVANDILRINQTYNGNLWNVPTGYATMAEQQNKPYVSAGAFSNGYNALAANANYLFFYDGYHLKAMDAATGATVGTVTTLTNQTVKEQGGIETNACDEVFIGGPNGNLLKYDFNGTNFTASATQFNIPGQNGNAVYDVVYNSLLQKFYICGDQFVATIDYIPPCLNNNAIQLQLDTLCPDSMRVTILNPDTTATYTFTLYDSLTSTQISTNIPPQGTYQNVFNNLLLNNTYTVTVVKNVPCQLQSVTVHFQLNCGDTTIYKCPNEYYVLNGDTLYAPGIYFDTLTNESVSIIDHPTHSDTVSASICVGDSYTLPSNTIVSSAGTYVDSFVNEFGCDSLITTELSVLSHIFESDTATICTGESYTLPSGTMVSQAGVYTSLFTSSYGCDSTIETTLFTTDPPIVQLPNDTVICEGTAISVDVAVGNPSAIYTWSDQFTGSGRILSTEGTFIAYIEIPPCAPRADSIIVGIKECNCRLFIPNAFSPNGDTKNELFKPNLQCLFYPDNYTFRVFNRWGQQVFTTSDYRLGWNGQLNNEDQPIGTYFYTLRYTNPNSKREYRYQGDITLIR